MTQLSPCPKQTPVKSQTKYTGGFRVPLKHEGKQSAGLTMPNKSVFKGMKKEMQVQILFLLWQSNGVSEKNTGIRQYLLNWMLLAYYVNVMTFRNNNDQSLTSICV